MDISAFQNMDQQQKLILTHEMQQSLKILQMPIIELVQQVNKELEQNPVLETIPEDSIYQDDDYSKESLEFDFSKLIIENDITYTKSPEEKELLNFVVEKVTLRQYLAEQIIDLQEEKQVIHICNYIADNLDNRGYLACTLEEIAKDLQVSISKADYALKLVQSLQPFGIAARDLKECLKIQLLNRNIKDKELYRIVDKHLELVADNKIKQISKNLNIAIEKTQQYCNLIKTLEPKPSRGFYTGEAENFVIPDAYVRNIGTDFYIAINETSLPKLTINKSYKEFINNQDNPRVSAYIKDNLNNASYLIRGIENRNKTIYNILNTILKIQREYFEVGKQNLKPMVIADIASILKIHESTVSRAIKNKYIGTPYGTVKIKDLFTVGIESDFANDIISKNQIKAEIKKIIDKEDKVYPVSDQDICIMLASMKMKVSRRTVTKYREAMGILSSNRRKKY